MRVQRLLIDTSRSLTFQRENLIDCFIYFLGWGFYKSTKSAQPFLIIATHLSVSISLCVFVWNRAQVVITFQSYRMKEGIGVLDCEWVPVQWMSLVGPLAGRRCRKAVDRRIQWLRNRKEAAGSVGCRQCRPSAGRRFRCNKAPKKTHFFYFPSELSVDGPVLVASVAQSNAQCYVKGKGNPTFFLACCVLPYEPTKLPWRTRRRLWTLRRTRRLPICRNSFVFFNM